MANIRHVKEKNVADLVVVSFLLVSSVIVIDISSVYLFLYAVLFNSGVFLLVLYYVEYDTNDKKLRQTYIPLMLLFGQIISSVILSNALSQSEQDIFLSLIVSSSITYILYLVTNGQSTTSD